MSRHRWYTGTPSVHNLTTWIHRRQTKSRGIILHVHSLIHHSNVSRLSWLNCWCRFLACTLSNEQQLASTSVIKIQWTCCLPQNCNNTAAPAHFDFNAVRAFYLFILCFFFHSRLPLLPAGTFTLHSYCLKVAKYTRQCSTKCQLSMPLLFTIYNIQFFVFFVLFLHLLRYHLLADNMNRQ